MPKTEAFFEDIQGTIKELLLSANVEIVLAVAWFTDKELFQILRKKAAMGITVQLAIHNDHINHTSSGILYDQLCQVGGEVHRITAQSKGQLMHHKFCVIDRQTVITGSYNWSKQAQQNHENIVVSSPDPDLANQFLLAFGDILKSNKIRSSWSNTLKPDTQQVLKRLSLIQQLVELGDYEDIDRQLSKLGGSHYVPDLYAITELLSEGVYEEAVTLIAQYIKAHTEMVVYIDPEISKMEREITVLELQLQAIEDQLAEVTRLVHTFQQQYFDELGDLVNEYLDLKARQKRKEADAARNKMGKASKQAEADYKKAKANAEDFKQRHEEAKDQPATNQLSKDETKELRSLYRKAAQKCHPDRVSEEDKESAHKIFVNLGEAYQSNDLEMVRRIWEQLENSEGFELDSDKNIDMSMGKLKARVSELMLLIAEKISDLDVLMKTDSYQKLTMHDDWLDYFEQERERLLHSIVELKKI